MKKVWNTAKKQNGKKQRLEKEKFEKTTYIGWWEALVCIVFGLIFGPLVSYSVLCDNATVNIEETDSLTAIYDSYERHYGPRFSRVDIFFEDIEKLEIGNGYSGVDWDQLDDIDPGTRVNIRLHPVSHTIMELKTANGEYCPLDFNDSQNFPWWIELMGYSLMAFCWGSVIYPVVKICKKEVL